MEMLKDVKVRQIHEPITLVFTRKIAEEAKVKDKELIPLVDYLNKIKLDNSAWLELYKYLCRDIRSKDSEEDINYIYKEHKGNLLYKEFISNSKTIFKALKAYNLEDTKIEIFSYILDIYTKNKKNKPLGKTVRDILLLNLKRVSFI